MVNSNGMKAASNRIVLNCDGHNLRVKDVVDFVWAYKKDTGFKGWEYGDIAIIVEQYINSKSFFYCLDQDGKLEGIILVISINFCKTFHVVHFVCRTTKAFTDFLQFLLNKFPDWTIQGFRNGKMFDYGLADRFAQRGIKLNEQRNISTLPSQSIFNN